MLILFDLDGTLIDSKESIIDSTILTLIKYSNELPSKSEIEKTVGIPISNLLKQYVDSSVLNQAINEFREFLIQETSKTTKLYHDTLKVLNVLSNKCNNLKIVTNKKTILAKKIINLMKIDNYFDDVIGIDLGDPKPSPSLLLFAAVGHNKSEVVMIGDRAEDVAAAKSAGFKSVFVNHSPIFRAEAETLQPDFVIDHLEELLDFDLMK